MIIVTLPKKINFKRSFMSEPDFKDMEIEDFHFLNGTKILGFDVPVDFPRSEVIYSVETEKGIVVFHHYTSCCERVFLEEAMGDSKSLIGETIVSFQEVSSDDAPAVDYESFTWTFYNIVTTNSDLTLRFLGRSNGYYSERVDLGWVPI
jgi:hypothetical protein